MTQSTESKINLWLKYLNTGLLTMILGISSMVAVKLDSLQEKAETNSTELVRIKTVQDYNSDKILNHEGRITTLELFNTTMIKDWVDANYIRKPQR